MVAAKFSSRRLAVLLPSLAMLSCTTQASHSNDQMGLPMAGANAAGVSGLPSAGMTGLPTAGTTGMPIAGTSAGSAGVTGGTAGVTGNVDGGGMAMTDGGMSVDPGPATFSNWPCYGHDLANTRHNPDEKWITRSNVNTLVKKWTATSSAVTSTPALYDGVIYFGSWDGKLYAVDAKSGAAKWATPLQNSVGIAKSQMLAGSPFVTANQVFIAGDGAQVFGVKRDSGVQQWKVVADNSDTDSERIWSSPIVADNTLLIGNGSYEVFVADVKTAPCSGQCGTFTFIGNIAALDTSNGAAKWKTKVADGSHLGVSVWSSAALDTDTKIAYIGTGQGYAKTGSSAASDKSDSLVALDYANGGAIKWSHQYTAGDVWSLGGTQVKDWDVGATPNLFEVGGVKLVGVGDKGGNYYVHDRATGTIKWSRALTPGSHLGGVMSSAAFDGDTIYVASNNGETGDASSAYPVKAMVYALEAATGNVKWMKEVTPGVIGGVTVANGVLYFNNTTPSMGMLHAWSTADGAELWTQSFGSSGAAGGVTVSGGMVFVGFGWAWQTAPAGGVTAFGLP